jgi:membrane-associated phospholipid phosphatase
VPTVNDKAHDHRVILLVSLMFLFGFLLVAALQSSFVTLDLNVNAWAASINRDSFAVVAEDISVVFDTNGLLIMAMVLAAAFCVKDRWRYGVLLIGAIGGMALIVAVPKMLIMSPRPLNEVVHLTDYSFPSGHVAGNVVFFGILTYFAWKNWASARAKLATGGSYITIVVLIGFDRIYLNVHWLSDVLAGFLLGAFWLVFTLWVFHRVATKERALQDMGLR